MNNEQNDLEQPLSLPKPQVDQLPTINETGGAQVSNEAAQAKSVEIASSDWGQQGTTSPSNQPVTSPGLLSTSPDPSTISPHSQSMPAIADDVDLIEKEWVNKAKEIVAKTKSDPHEQNKEVTKVKAEYLKKRYNKDLKLAE